MKEDACFIVWGDEFPLDMKLCGECRMAIWFLTFERSLLIAMVHM